MIENAPAGYATVQPWLVSRDTGRLLDFISAAFGGQEIARIPTEDGGIGHAEIRVGTSMLLPFDAQPDWPDTPSMLRVFVDDADAAFDRAVRAGARVVTPLDDAAWGDRGGRVRDPLGNIWWVVQHVTDVPPDEIAARLQDPKYGESMARAQATLDAELGTGGNNWSSPPVLEAHLSEAEVVV
jgi:PhnB protein